MERLIFEFVTGLSISTYWKDKIYASILIIVDWLIKMVYYKPVMVIIDTPALAEVIITVVV